MASINANEVDIGVVKGATWGTAVDLTSAGKLLHATSLSITGGYEIVQPNDAGFENFITENTRIRENFDVSITCDLSYGGTWLQFVAALLGTASAPSEQTVGEGDYLSTLDLASENRGDFLTVAWKNEDDKILEIPSLKVSAIDVNMETPGTGTITITGMGDKLLYDTAATNTIAILNGLTAPTYQMAAFSCGTNIYARVGDYSTGTALSASDDIQIMNFTFNVTRPLQRRYVANGSDSCRTLEPYQAGKTTGTFNFQLSEIDDSIYDLVNIFQNATQQMAEIFFDGDQIGAGVNTSLKLQFPYMQNDELPETGFTSNTDIRQPTVNFTLLQAPAAPAGMSGVTNYLRVTTIDERSSAYI